MATPRRRSARLRKSATPDRSAIKERSAAENKLGTLLERDETPDVGADAQPSLDTILSTPNGVPDPAMQDRMAQLSALKTPKTGLRPSHAEMHPEDAHKSTMKAPDSGLRLGFTDVSGSCNQSLAEAQNTPTKTQSAQCLPEQLSSPGFEFEFASESNLSSEAQKLMDKVREEAARIKAQTRLEQVEQERNDAEAKDMVRTYNLTGRKIAQPRGKAKRFSDIHMAEFKKMDSIANHASAWRATPGYLQPTGQSLKRSGSKAELDESERPRTAERSSPIKSSPVKPSTTPRRRLAARSPTKAAAPSFNSPAKRARVQGPDEAIATSELKKTNGDAGYQISQSRMGFGFPSSLFTPTKASLARSASVKEADTSPSKGSMIPKSANVKTLNSLTSTTPSASQIGVDLNTSGAASLNADVKSPSARSEHTKALRNDQSAAQKPLPSLPLEPQTMSKLPKLSGLKSILRRRQPLFSNDPIKIAAGTHVASPTGGQVIHNILSNLSSDGIGTPERRMTKGGATPSARKHVNFSSSTNARHELALASPSPSKIPLGRSDKRQDTPYAPAVMFDPTTYTLDEDIHYPSLHVDSSSEPSSPLPASMAQTAKEVSQQHVLSRDSPHFKSIFTTLPRPSTADSTLTATTARKSRSPSSSPFKESPSTIRRVGETAAGVVSHIQPFEDMPTVPHGLPGKKRRRESVDELDTNEIDPEKNSNVKYPAISRRSSVMPSVPGGFPSDSPNATNGPSAKRRKTRMVQSGDIELNGSHIGDGSSMKENLPLDSTSIGGTSPKKQTKPSAARTVAANAAKERKAGTPGKGFLTMSRLNMLARPKDRK